MKRKTRIPAIAAALMLMFGITAAPSMAASPGIEDIEYEGGGRVDVEFYEDVSYKSCKVTVKDTSGKKYKASILHKDDDDVKFRIRNYKAGKTYRFTIKGVKVWGTNGYGSVKGKVKIPAAGKVVVRNVEYDGEDRQVDFEFKGNVKWSDDPKVSIERNGKEYSRGIVEWDNDGLEVSVKRLDYGAKYSYKITGVASADGGSYKTVKGSFRAYGDD